MKFIYVTLALAIILSTACITVVQPGATAPGGTTPSAQKPAAFIDRISPSSLNWGESVTLSGTALLPAAASQATSGAPLSTVTWAAGQILIRLNYHQAIISSFSQCRTVRATGPSRRRVR